MQEGKLGEELHCIVPKDEPLVGTYVRGSVLFVNN